MRAENEMKFHIAESDLRLVTT